MTWVHPDRVAAALRVRRRSVRRRAEREGWRTLERPSNGGTVQMLCLEDLPPEVRRELHTSNDAAGLVLDALSEKQRSAMGGKQRAVEAWQAHLAAAGKSKRDATADFVAEWNGANEPRVAWSTLHRWAQALEQGGADGLLHGGAGSEMAEELRRFFLSQYLHDSRPSIAFCYQLARHHASAIGLKIPAVDSFKRLVRDIPKSVLVYYREGRKAFYDECSPYILRDYNDPELISNRCWVSDHHQFDFWVQNPWTGKPVRPWLTAWMDFRSRKMVGWLVHTNPNTDTVLAAFRHGVTRYGIPDELYLDNGKDYRNSTFAGGRKAFKVELEEERVRTLVSHLGVIPHFAIPYNARAKHIERAFRTLSETLSKLFQGYCGRSPETRPERVTGLVREGDVPSLHEVQGLFDSWVEEYYNARSHEGAGMGGASPNEVYDRLLVQRRTCDPAVLRVLMMRATRAVHVGRQGVKVLEHYYVNDEGLFAHQGKNAYVRYDPSDMSTVEVYDLEDRWICQARLLGTVPALGATADDLKEAARRHKRVRELVRGYTEGFPKRLEGEAALAAVVADRRQHHPDHEPTGAQVIMLVRPEIEVPDRPSPTGDTGELAEVVQFPLRQKDPDPAAMWAAMYGRWGAEERAE